MTDSTRIVFISDTHGKHNFDVPMGDLLVHCGDGTPRGRPHEVRVWGEWMRGLQHETKIFIAGNHDFLFQHDLRHALFCMGRAESGAAATEAFGGPAHHPFLGAARIESGLHYIQDTTVSLNGPCLCDIREGPDNMDVERVTVKECSQHGVGRRLRVHGSPWQPEFYSWAFNLARGPEIAAMWKVIPHGLDLLITHGPPAGILDLVDNRPEHVGCADLKQRVADTSPRIHAFGHIHEQHGTLFAGGTLFVNAAICDLNYEPVQAPIVVDLPHDRSLDPVVVPS